MAECARIYSPPVLRVAMRVAVAMGRGTVVVDDAAERTLLTTELAEDEERRGVRDDLPRVLRAMFSFSWSRASEASTSWPTCLSGATFSLLLSSRLSRISTFELQPPTRRLYGLASSSEESESSEVDEVVLCRLALRVERESWLARDGCRLDLSGVSLVLAASKPAGEETVRERLG